MFLFIVKLIWLRGALISIKPRLHDTTGCQTCLTTGLKNSCIVYTAGCQSGCTTRFDNRLNEQLFVQHGCQTGWQTRLTTGCIVYTNIQPVVKLVWQPVGCLFTRYSRLSNVNLVVQPVWQPVVLCKRGLTITGLVSCDICLQALKVPWLSIAKSLPVWAVAIAHFTNNWGYYTLLTCLPMYLKNILHFDMKSVSRCVYGVLQHCQFWSIA